MSAPPPAKFAAIEAAVENLTPDAQLAFSNDKNSLKKMRKELQELRKLVKEAKVESLGVKPPERKQPTASYPRQLIYPPPVAPQMPMQGMSLPPPPAFYASSAQPSAAPPAATSLPPPPVPSQPLPSVHAPLLATMQSLQ